MAKIVKNESTEPRKTAAKKATPKSKASNISDTNTEEPKIKAVKKPKVVKTETEILLETIVNAMQNKKSKSLVTLDLHNIHARITDHFVICHGTSNTQVSAIADSVEHDVRKLLKIKPWHREGFENSEWILLDYVDVIVHIFQEETRNFYQLEKLWADAERKDFEDIE